MFELRHMNDDFFENQKDGDCSLKNSEPFKKQYAAVLLQLNEVNEQASISLDLLLVSILFLYHAQALFSRDITLAVFLSYAGFFCSTSLEKTQHISGNLPSHVV